jgi:hypothetical protein
MWAKARTKASTLLELVVTLLVSTVLFGAAYLFLQHIQLYYQGFSRTTGEALEVNGLRHALAHDFDRSRYVLRHGEGITCYADSGAAAYLFQEGQVLRLVDHSPRADTFRVAVGELLTKAEGRAVLEKGRLVETLSFSLFCRQDTFRVHLVHPYSAEEKMNFMGTEFGPR